MKNFRSLFLAALLLYVSTAEAAYTPSMYPRVFSCDGTNQTTAITAALSIDGNNLLFAGTCKTNGISVSGKNLTIDFAEGAVLKPASKIDTLWQFTGGTVTIKRLSIDGDGLVQKALRFNSATVVQADTITLTDIGYPVDAATASVIGVHFSSVASAKVNRITASNFHAIGDGTLGNSLGEVRAVYTSGSGIIDIGTLDVSGGDSQEDNDYFHAELNNTGGTIRNLVARYNGNTRRVAKFQSGRWVIMNADIRPGSDFTADSGSTQVGTYNLNAVDWATNAAGSLDIQSGYLDCTGYVVCVGNSGGTAQVRVSSGVTMQGPILAVIRTNPDSGSPQNQDAIGFYSSTNDVGSGIDGATINNFGKGAALQGKQSFAKNVKFVDQVNFAAEVGSGTQRSSIEFSNNEVITRTPGYLNSTRIVRVFNVLNVKVLNNRLTQDGNTTHATQFIGVTDASATGRACGNVAPAGTTAVSIGSSTVTTQCIASGDVADNAITNAKLATASNNTIKSNISGSTAVPSDNTLTALLDTISSTQGSVLYRGASAWSALTPGTNGHFLKTNGAAANPSWAAAAVSSSTIPSGTFSSKPGSPTQGDLYFATDLGTNGVLIAYSGSVWKPASGAAVIYQSGVQTTMHTGDTNNTNVQTVTIPAGLLSANGALRITVYGAATGTAGTKTYRIYYSATSGGANGTNITSTTAVAASLSIVITKAIVNQNSTSSQITSSTLNTGSGSSSNADVTTAINTANTSYLNFTVQLANSGDSAGIDALTVEWLEP